MEPHMNHGRFNQIPVHVRAILIIAFFLPLASCSKAQTKQTGIQVQDRKTATFIELGSVNCIPCKAMQPIMKDIEKRYGDQVKVVFYDVWTDEGKPFGSFYRIRVIPTQVFLDRNGKEYFRHEGYFPIEEVLKILEKGGVRL
jgi:thioredoxin 1